MKHDEVVKYWNENAEAWIRASEYGFDIWRDVLNTPVFLKVLPTLRNLIGLDIGCGDGHNSQLIAQQCKQLIGIDLSEKLLSAAIKNSQLDNLHFQQANATNLPFLTNTFDFIVATMSFMDMAEINKVFSEAYRVLKPDGFLQFSILHPCFNEHKGHWVENEESHCIGFIMKDYFVQDQGDIHEWKHRFSPETEKPFRVPRFSKPLSTWFNTLFKSGFFVEMLEEPYANETILKQYPQLASTKVVAHSLIIRCRKIDYYRFNEEILKKLPGNIWWKNNNLIYQGCNNTVAKIIKRTIKDTIIGKTDYDLWPKKIADKLYDCDMQVLSTAKSVTLEETIIDNKKEKIMLTNKSPLFDKNKNIIGILGTSTDITARKRIEKDLIKAKEEAESSLNAVKKAQKEEQKQRQKAEQFKSESLTNKAQLEAQQQITHIANQVAHDIRSPLASLLMILNSCNELPEEKRISLRAASMRIEDIANNLLNQYSTKQDVEHETATQPVLVSATLLQLLTEKRFQYQGLPIKLESKFSKKSHFAFIETPLSSFQRMVSNLINNAIEALEHKPGTVTLTLDATDTSLLLRIIDTGKGMSPTLLKKLKQKIAITEGKANGHGIGLSQVHETLAASQATMDITSILGKGSSFQLRFPRQPAPLWCAEDIGLNPDNIILILDDDHSIHHAWDIRFKPLLKKEPTLSIHHFEEADAALRFITNLDKQAQHRVLLLTDYELLGQHYNGLDVINKSNLERAILVTSHYLNENIQKKAMLLKTKILPKQLASDITIRINAIKPHHKITNHVQAIFVDDDELFINTLTMFLFNDADNIIHFNHPEALKKQLALYPKETLIYLDNHYPSGISGLEFAAWLYQQGYTRLYLLSGHVFPPGNLPPYLTSILKTDIHRIKQW